jgi:V/A-type H+-transporting ATPase subunit K
MMLLAPELIAVIGVLISIIVPGIGSGYAMQRIGELSESLLNTKERGFFTNALVFSVLAETPTIYGLLVAILILITIPKGLVEAQAYSILLAAIDIAIPGIAAAYAIGLVAQASLIAIKEKPSLFGKTLILCALPEAIAIYGLIVSLLILIASGVFGPSKVTALDQVGDIGIVSVIISLTAIVAIFIGRIAVSAVKSLLTNEAAFTQSLIIAVLPESIAVYALLVSVLILSNTGLI